MDGIVLLFLLAAWFVPAFGAAHLARRSGRSFGAWLLLGLLVPLLALIIAACFRPIEAAAALTNSGPRGPEDDCRAFLTAVATEVRGQTATVGGGSCDDCGLPTERVFCPAQSDDEMFRVYRKWLLAYAKTHPWMDNPAEAYVEWGLPDGFPCHETAGGDGGQQ